MKIIVGLGNIGEKYHMTRHNAGFMLINELVKEIAKEENKEIQGSENSKLKAFCAKTSFMRQEVFIAKPLTLMNLSGQCVAAILNFFKETPKNLIVIYDDIDLALGTIRVREKGSAGTHNGMKSIIESLGSEDFTRIRIGIESRGDLSPQQQDLSNFVLSKFTEQELIALKPAFSEAIKAIKELLTK